MSTSGNTTIPFLFIISSASKLDTALVFSTKHLHCNLSALAKENKQFFINKSSFTIKIIQRITFIDEMINVSRDE